MARNWAAWNVEYRRVDGPGWRNANSTLEDSPWRTPATRRSVERQGHLLEDHEHEHSDHSIALCLLRVRFIVLVGEPLPGNMV